MKYTLAFIVLTFSLINTFATPSSATHQREVLLAANDDSYFTYTIQRTSGDTYYHFTDSVFLDRKAFDGKITERTLVRVSHHRDTTTNGDWMVEELVKEPMNVQEYLLKHKTSMIMSISELACDDIVIDYYGVNLMTEEKKELITEVVALKKFFPNIDEFYIEEQKTYDVKSIASYESKNHFFVLIEGGEGSSDMPFYQNIICLEKDNFWEKYNALSKRISNKE